MILSGLTYKLAKLWQKLSLDIAEVVAESTAKMEARSDRGYDCIDGEN